MLILPPKPAMITHPHATRCFLLAVGTVAALGLLLVAQPPLQPALSLVHGESAARTEGATHPETAESADGCIGNASGYACEPTFFIYGASKCATSSIAQYLVTPADTAAPTQPAAVPPSATDLGVSETKLEEWRSYEEQLYKEEDTIYPRYYDIFPCSYGWGRSNRIRCPTLAAGPCACSAMAAAFLRARRAC